MVTVVRSHQILVHAPLQSVFDYVSDLTRHPEWSGGRLKIEAITPGPNAVVKEYISHGDVAGQKGRPNRVQITQYESRTGLDLCPKILTSEMSHTNSHLQSKREAFSSRVR